MRVAVIGSGGREHALLWKLKQSPRIAELFALPGNPGMRGLARLCPVKPDVTSLVAEVLRLEIDFVVVGPEVPLADGIADALAGCGVSCFGPNAAAAQLESSKVFAKQLMRKCGVPTADFMIFDDIHECERFILENPRAQGRVVKADGLAAGKGAFVCANDAEALAVARRLLCEHMLGNAGQRIVVEEKLTGREASLHFLCDGERYLALPPAQDYKRALDGDHGANTGGMGTFCPARHATSELVRECERRIVEPVQRELRAAGTPYRGLLYVGVMLTQDGPQVIEFNCRFGDPETQVMLPCLGYDIFAAMEACANGTLDPSHYAPDTSQHAVCVVLCADGYPDSYQKQIPLIAPTASSGQLLFAAGTAEQDGQWVSNGGRVLNAVGLGESIADARANAYDLARRALVPGLRMRVDIALSEVA